MGHLENIDYEIAIIGMAGRFPGARNIAEFWRNLRDGVESISFFTDEELIAAGVDRALLSDAHYVRAAGVLDDAEFFDARFFGFNPREAELMDPQHRLFLECAWEALETTGYNSVAYDGRIGVYAGASLNTYLLNNLYSNRDLIESAGGFQIVIANDKDHLPTWVSYKLNLKGPSVNVQTSCSTSLVAVHLACQSLLNHECNMALAGGVSIRVPLKQGYLYQERGVSSPDGHCRAFDARAQGTVGGSGVGVVVLKRLADALDDGDYIHAIIKGSAINNDGSLKVGYTAPSMGGQESVIADAMAMAMVEPQSITYVETHGTGTALGDPIEIAALTQAFRARTGRRNFCALGSVKTNIGHLDAAAGVASLIKAVLALEHRQLPPSLHFEEPNPQIDFADSPFYVNSKLSEWTSGNTSRRAGVSSFGIGGTNAHLILEEALPTESSASRRNAHLLLLSAKTATALESATVNLVRHLKQQASINLADVAYTLQIGRGAFPHRCMLVGQTAEDVILALEEPDRKQVLTGFAETEERHIVFMFPGQGSQHVNMASELYRAEPLFREQVDLCCEILKPHLRLDLRELLYPRESVAAEVSGMLNQTFIAQPALFCVEYALAKLLMDWGVRPAALVGHSVGEYVAACLAGVFSLEDALSLIAARGRLMQQLPAGVMLAVPLSERELHPLLDEGLSLAATNAPALCVVSGPPDAMQRVEQRLANSGLGYQRLHTSHAFHSEMMNPILDPFMDELRKVDLKPPRIPYMSNVSGKWITASDATDVHYWANHLRCTVRFSEGITELLKEPDRIFLEVGPGQTLKTLVSQQSNETSGRVVLASLPRAPEREAQTESLLRTLGQLWLAGVELDWHAFHRQERLRRVPLPTYSFERERYWIEAGKSGQETPAPEAMLGRKQEVADWFYLPSWKRTAPPQLLGRKEAAEQKSRWLVLDSGSELCSGLLRRLAEAGHEVITVKRGERFAKLSDTAYEVNPRLRADYDALLNELRASQAVTLGVAHLWNLAPEVDSSIDLDGFEESQYSGFYSLLFLAQALGEQNLTSSIHICVVTNNMQEVTGGEGLCPQKATILGPCKVIQQEIPNITCRSIDVIIPPQGTRAEEELLAHLISELSLGGSEPVVAFRGSHRWAQVFEAVRLDEGAERETLREGGVYLLTGGLEEFNLALGEHLARAVRARLILVEPSAFPERDVWPEWLASHDEQNEVSRKIRAVLSLEESGASVIILKADVADREQMQHVITLARERFGEINGVIHSAGISGGGMIQLKSPEMAARVLTPKAKGALVLASLFRDTPLDFLVLSSSTLSITGVFGQVDYCAANAFLDAFAHEYHDSCGGNIISINWGTSQWERWQQPLLSGSSEMQAQLQQAQQQYGITYQEGVEAFNRILSARLPQIVVSTQDFQALVEQQHAFTAERFLEEMGAARQAQARRLGHAQLELSAPYAAPTDEIEKTVAEVWRELFGVGQLGVDDNFFELGGNSLLAIQLVSLLRKTFQVELPMGKLFESPTVSALARAISASQQEQREQEEMRRLLDEIEGLSHEEVQMRLAAGSQSGNE